MSVAHVVRKKQHDVRSPPCLGTAPGHLASLTPGAPRVPRDRATSSVFGASIAALRDAARRTAITHAIQMRISRFAASNFATLPALWDSIAICSIVCTLKARSIGLQRSSRRLDRTQSSRFFQ